MVSIFKFSGKEKYFIFYVTFSDMVINSSMLGGVSCYHRMVCPRVADGGNGLQLWSAAANTLNKQ
jgi:hypothetical protein